MKRVRKKRDYNYRAVFGNRRNGKDKSFRRISGVPGKEA